MRTTPSPEHLLQDVRIAVRRTWKTPGFTVAAIATLALGLGLTSAILSLAYALFLRPLPVSDASRLVFADGGFSVPDYLYYRDHARAFAELGGHYSTSPMNVVTPGGPVSVTGSVVTANYFTLLRLTPRAGRFFSACRCCCLAPAVCSSAVCSCFTAARASTLIAWPSCGSGRASWTTPTIAPGPISAM